MHSDGGIGIGTPFHCAMEEGSCAAASGGGYECHAGLNSWIGAISAAMV
jgi:hypothetical protein